MRISDWSSDVCSSDLRVSGDVNLAALRVVNAANIDVQGDATGIPIVAAVNTGALTAASNAASAVSNAAARIAERTRPQSIRDIPSIITGRLLGFGEYRLNFGSSCEAPRRSVNFQETFR